MKEVTKIAIIGVGRWGKNHLREFSSISGVEIISVFHNDSPETSKWLRDNYPKILVSKSLEEICENKEIDAVVIATPIKTHFEIAKKILKSGKHVFIEKPIANNLEEAEELISISDEVEKIIFVGYTFIYNHAYIKLKSLIEERQEKIESIFSSWNKWGSFKEDLIENLLCHDVSIIIDLLGKIDQSKKLFSQGIVSKEDIASFEFQCGDIKAISVINRCSNHKQKSLTIKTDNHTYLWEDDNLFELYAEERVLITAPTESQLTSECKEFVNTIRKKLIPKTDKYFGLEITKILDSLTLLQ